MAGPIFESPSFPFNLPEAQALRNALKNTWFKPDEALQVAQGGGLSPGDLDMTGSPQTFWGTILNTASQQGLLQALVDHVAGLPINVTLKTAIERLRNANEAALASRLLLDGDRPFLGRKKLRDLLPRLRNWSSAAAVLVVRGTPDSGRTSTQVLLADRNDDMHVLLDESLSLKTSMTDVWNASGATTPLALAPTTEDAALQEFWGDVLRALEGSNRRMWVLVDDLDADRTGRVEVRALADALAVRLNAVSFQRRLRLVMLGDANLRVAERVHGTIVVEDQTELFDETHVAAFLDYCVKARDKVLAKDAIATKSTELCNAARAAEAAQPPSRKPYQQALHELLVGWYAELG